MHMQNFLGGEPFFGHFKSLGCLQSFQTIMNACGEFSLAAMLEAETDWTP